MDLGGVLVSDDQTKLSLNEDRVIASAPVTIAGMIEVRGIGLVKVPHLDRVPLGLVVDLTTSEKVERLPEPQSTTYLGIPVPLLQLVAFHASTPAKIRWWINHRPGDPL
jgi:serine kinase of HPr protein (carbohydrate metabolism regulator)